MSNTNNDPIGLPARVDHELEAWSTRYGKSLEQADIDEIQGNLGAFFELLLTWKTQSNGRGGMEA